MNGVDITDSRDIAIIGMSGRFPGANTIDAFWRNVRDGRETTCFFSDEELRKAGVDATHLDDSSYVKAKPILDKIDYFDADFFGIGPGEALTMDPQQRFFLECAWEALEDAGHLSDACNGRIGLYAGMAISTYLFHLISTGYLDLNNFIHDSSDLLRVLIGNSKDQLATRTSYKLDLTGPSISVQTACSTSLVAVTLACQGLLDYQCDMALAGGVSIRLPQTVGYHYEEDGILSRDGHCRPFDINAQGTVFGNGLGIVVLKRLEDALADYDHIYAVIKGFAVNNDGKEKVGYTAPSVNGQAQVIAEALAMADVSPESISYVEAHGTGTSLGDPIEITALTQAFREVTNARQFCAIGSVKSNFGHLNTAAGVVGLIKTALALKHRQIPPSLHFTQPNPMLDLENSPFYVNVELKKWEQEGHALRAGVSSFGIGGTNAHVVLEEPPGSAFSTSPDESQLIVLSARSKQALETATNHLVGFLEVNSSQSLADIAFTLQTGRQAFANRRMVICKTVKETSKALERRHASEVSDHAFDGQEPPVIFMFPGQGTQYVNMGSGLYHTEHVYRDCIDHCSELLNEHIGCDLRDVIYPSTDRNKAARKKLSQTAIAQPACVAVSYAMARLWIDRGVQPFAMMGHSLGEYVAACLANVVSLEDVLSLVALRGRLMQDLPAGAMLAVYTQPEYIRDLLTPDISLAAVNTSEQCVISGPVEAIENLKKSLSQVGIECSQLHTLRAFHSSMMDPILPAFESYLKTLDLKLPQIPYISNLTGKWIEEECTDPGYWTDHIRHPVMFSKGLDVFCKEPNAVLLDMGPGRTLSTMSRRHVGAASSNLILSSSRSSHDEISDRAILLQTAGQLWLHGVGQDWTRFYANDRHPHRISLPTYPFERQRYWIDATTNGSPICPSSPESTVALESHRCANITTRSNSHLTITEEKITQIWQDVLGIERIDIHDRYSELGGDSLIAIRIASRIREAFQIDLPVKALFECETIAELATVIEDILVQEMEHMS